MFRNKKMDRNSPEYKKLIAQESLICDATELICERMIEVGITRADLARRIGKTRGFITQILSGKRNMTLRTLSDLAFALDMDITIARKDF